MMYRVLITNASGDYWLRGTTWTGSIERASLFETKEAANVAIKASHTRRPMRKLIQIVVAEEEGE